MLVNRQANTVTLKTQPNVSIVIDKQDQGERQSNVPNVTGPFTFPT